MESGRFITLIAFIYHILLFSSNFDCSPLFLCNSPLTEVIPKITTLSNMSVLVAVFGYVATTPQSIFDQSIGAGLLVMALDVPISSYVYAVHKATLTLLTQCPENKKRFPPLLSPCLLFQRIPLPNIHKYCPTPFHILHLH